MMSSGFSEEPSWEPVVSDAVRQEFGEFFEQTWRTALYRARLFVSGDEAEDVMHDAYALALERWEKILRALEPHQRSAWVKTAVTLIARQRLRRVTTYNKCLPGLYEPGADHYPDPADVALAAATARTCLKVIVEMPDDLRVVSLLCWVDGFTPLEIAKVLGLPAGTVRRKLKSARDQLYVLVGADLTFEVKYGKTREGGAAR